MERDEAQALLAEIRALRDDVSALRVGLAGLMWCHVGMLVGKRDFVNGLVSRTSRTLLEGLSLPESAPEAARELLAVLESVEAKDDQAQASTEVPLESLEPPE